MNYYLYLSVAVLAEVLGTIALKASEQFTRLWPSIFTVIAYIFAFYFLSLTLRAIPVGIAYAIWAGLGIFLITLSAIFIYHQIPDIPAIIGLSLITLGVVIINLFSKTSVH